MTALSTNYYCICIIHQGIFCLCDENEIPGLFVAPQSSEKVLRTLLKIIDLYISAVSHAN